MVASIGDDDIIENDIQVINDIKMWHVSYKDTTPPYLVTLRVYHFIDYRTSKLIEVLFIQDEDDNPGFDYSEEFEKMIHSIYIVENPLDQSSATEYFKDFIAGNYVIQIPEKWEVDEDTCYSMDEGIFVVFDETSLSGYTDVDDEKAFEERLALIGKDNIIDSGTQIINKIKMRYVKYKDVLDNDSPVIIYRYTFINAKTTKGQCFMFYQADVSEDYTDLIDQVIHSIHWADGSVNK